MTLRELIGNVKVNEGSEDFERGVVCGDDMKSVHVAINNVWGADAKNGGVVTSYEKIGYHTGSTDFIAGVLFSGCPIRVARVEDNRVVWHELKG